jgi:hypothetical protein
MTTTPTMLGNRLTAFDIAADGRAPGTRGLEDLFHGRPLPHLPAGAERKDGWMRRIVVSEFVSLDGVVEDPSWTFRFGSEEREKFKLDELAESDALLLGRVTYEGFAEALPRMNDETGLRT